MSDSSDDSSDDSEESTPRPSTLFSFPVLPKIDGGERRTAVSEEIIRERTVANIDRNSDRTDIPTIINPLQVLPGIEQTTANSANSSLGYYKVDFPDHKPIDQIKDQLGDDGLLSVETSIIQHITTLLHSHDTIIVVGVPGSGKTLLGRQLSQCLKNDLTPVQIFSVIQLVQMVKFDENQFFFFDDAFGKERPNFERTLWKTVSKKWQETVNKKRIDSKISKLILSTRGECIPYNPPLDYVLVDMSKDCPFINQDRRKILNFHGSIIEKKETDNLVIHIGEQIYNDIGFPLCSFLYTNSFFTLDPKVYFTNPLPYLILSYQNKLAESDMAVCISNILVLNAGTFHSDADLNADTKALIHYPTTIADVLTFSHTMMKPFLNICGGKTIQFVHPCLLTTSEIYMFNNDQRKGLKYMSMKTICKYIKIPSKQSTKIQYGITVVDFLSYNNWNTIADRMISELFNGNIRFVCSHPILKNQQFMYNIQKALRKIYRGDKQKMIRVFCDLFLTIDNISSDGVLFWSIYYGNESFYKMLLRLYDFCGKHEDLLLGVLSRALIGLCLNKSPLLLVIELEKRGADISYCDACSKMNISSNIPTDTNNDLHVCPLQAVIQSDNLHTFKYLLQKGAVIPHSKWCQWKLLCNLAKVNSIFVDSFDFFLALDETFSTCINCEHDTIKQSNNQSLYSKFKTMLREIHTPSDINDIFLTFLRNNFANQAMCEVFRSCGLDMSYCNRKQRNAVNVLLWKYKEDPQCISVNDESCLSFLLKMGFDPNNTAADGTFPLLLAIGEKSCNIKVISLLLEAGASVEKRTLNGLTPLHLCIKSRIPLEQKSSLVSLFLRYHANPNDTDRRGRSCAQLIFEQAQIHGIILLMVSKWPIQECLLSRIDQTTKIRIIKELVREGIDVNMRDDQNQTPILLTCMLNNKFLTEELLSLGGDVNILYSCNCSIIQKLLLSRHENVENVLSVLIDASENIHHSNEKGDTALHTAMKSKRSRYNEIKLLMSVTDLERHGTTNNDQKTVMHLAAACKTLTDTEAYDICNTYICVCGGFDDRDKFGTTALEYASLCSIRRPKTICLLLKHLNAIEIGSNFLINLIEKGHMCEEVDYVLKNAKYYNFIVQEDEFILHKLASTCPVTANQIRLPFRHLCDLGVNIDLLDLNGNTPLIQSCSSTINVVLAKDLMQRGADVNLQNERGNTALHECILSSATDTVLNLICRCFRNYSFNMSIRNIDGLSVIHLLTAHMFSERTNTFKTLLNATNDINLTDLKGNTVLHKIVMLSENDMNVSSRVADVLDTSDDVDTEIKGSNGRTVLNMACSYSKYSRFSTILLLLKYGADINSRDKFGNTPLYNVVKFLEGYDIITVFERFIRVLALLSLDCDLEGNRTDTPVQLSRTRQYNDVCDILTKYEISKAVTYLNDIVGKLLRRYQTRIHVAHLPSHKKLSKEIVNIINKAYSRIGHLRFDTDDDLELGSDYVDVNRSTALYSHRQSENFSTRVRESSSGANSLSEDCIDSKVNFSHNDVSSRSSETTRNTSPSGYGTLDYNTSTDDNYGQYESMIDDDQEEDNDDDD